MEDKYHKLGAAAREGNIEEVKKRLLNGDIPDDEIYREAHENIQALFDYRPGRNNPTIYEFIQQNFESRMYHITRKKELTRLLMDYEDTTETSSDEEIQEYNNDDELEFFNHHDNMRLKRIKEYNEKLKNELKDIDFDEVFLEFSDLRIVVFRGFHYDPQYFDKQKRHAHAAIKTQNEITISSATQEMANLGGELIVTELNKELIEAHGKVLEFFKNLKIQTDKKENIPTTRNKKEFKNLYYRFVQAYVENYQKMFSHDGLITNHFGFDSNRNPAISTSILAEKSSCYSSGIRMNEDHLLNPHYRRFTQKPKHPCVGVLYAYEMDLQYFFEAGCFMLDNIFNENFGISHIKQFEYEVMFESLIPGKYQVDRQLFIFPSLAEWSDSLKNHFGYTKRTFENDRNSLFDLPAGDKENRNKFLTKIVEERVAKKQSEILERRIKKNLSRQNYFIVYPFKNRLLTESPSTPKDKKRWRRPIDLQPVPLNPSKKLSIFSSEEILDVLYDEQVDKLKKFLSIPDYIHFFNEPIYYNDMNVSHEPMCDFTTVMHLAVDRGNDDILGALLTCQQINVNYAVNETADQVGSEDYKYYEKITPLHFAIMLNKPFVIKTLLGFKRVDKHALASCVLNKLEETVFLSEENIKEVGVFKDIECLKDFWCYRSSYVGVRRINGLSGLHLAVIFSDINVLEILLNEGLDIFQKDTDGNTALDIAMQLKKHDMIIFLQGLQEKHSLSLVEGIKKLNFTEDSYSPNSPESLTIPEFLFGETEYHSHDINIPSILYVPQQFNGPNKHGAEAEDLQDSCQSQHTQNSSVTHFMNEGALHFNNWYHPDICHDLLQMTSNQAKCIRVIFHDEGNNTEAFKNQLRPLVMLGNLLKRPALFISKEPGADNHFICGLVKNNNLLLINPLGIPSQGTCYQILAELKKERIIQEIWISSNSLQKRDFEERLVSCGPITLELAIHILTHFTPEDLDLFWKNHLKTTEPTTHDASGLIYYGINIIYLLPQTLHEILHTSNEATYQQKICAIRQYHCVQLQTLPIALTKNTTISVEEYLLNCKENAVAQVIFNALITEETITNICEWDEYKQLEEELNSQIPQTTLPLKETMISINGSGSNEINQQISGKNHNSDESLENSYSSDNPFEQSKLLADQGDVDEQLYIGNCYKDGLGVKQDQQLAFKYFQMAAVQGDACAENNVGVFYLRGEVITQDFSLAVKYFHRSANQGNVSAHTNLGICYVNGLGVNPDHKIAVKCFHVAAKHGDEDAQFLINKLKMGPLKPEKSYKESEQSNFWKKQQQGSINPVEQKESLNNFQNV